MRRTGIVRPVAAVVMGLATVVAAAVPAWAHEEINPNSVPTGKPAFFILTAADEKTVALTTITLTAPPGVPFGTTTHQPAGWTVKRGDDAITWSGGQVAPDNFQQWGFEIEGADQPGVLGYKVTLGFADGTSEDAQVDVTAVTPAAGEPSATSATGASPTTATTPSSGAKAEAEDADSAEGRANTALAVAIVAGVLALTGVGLGLRRERGSTPDAADADAEGGQDW